MPVEALVPPELRHAPFRGSVARAHGLLTPRQLAGASWVRLLPDVYVHRDVDLTAGLRIEAVRLVQPDAIVAGRTAAWLHGVWRPAPGQVVPIEIARLRERGPLARKQVRSSRRVWLTLCDADDVVEVGGLAVTSPERTCFDLVRERSLVEAVVVVDAFAFAGAIWLPYFAAYADAHRRWPGVRLARAAASLASPHAASPGESRMRMVVVLSGWPEPLVNVPFETSVGTWVPDLTLLWVPRPVGLEYDGAYHFEAVQHVRDLRRENTILVCGGLPLLRYDHRAVSLERHRMVAEIAAATGEPARIELDDADFDAGSRLTRW